MNKRSRRILSGLAILFFIALLAIVAIVIVFRRGDSFHPASTQRQAIWFSKRVVAQACSYVFAVWDPYASSHRYAVTGPKVDEDRKPPGPALKTREALQEFFDGSSRFRGTGVRVFLNGGLPESRFRFYYQSADESKLDSLAKLYFPPGTVPADSDDYLALAGISRRLHEYFGSRSQGRESILRVDFNFNALDILYRAGQGERFWCSEYATSLVQCLASLGYTARYVMLNSDTGGHVACEAWSETYGKWVLLDPFYCRRVTLDGTPLNVYEIHRLQANPEKAARAVVLQSGELLTDRESRDFYLSLFRNFAVRMRNDWFTNRYPHWYPLSNSVMNAVEWQDELTGDNIYYRSETGDLEDLYWPLNRTRISIHPTGSDRLAVFLDTFTPNFSHFRLELDDSPVQELREAAFDWHLRPGLNVLRLAAVNRWGIAGRPVLVEIEWNEAREE